MLGAIRNRVFRLLNKSDERDKLIYELQVHRLKSAHAMNVLREQAAYEKRLKDLNAGDTVKYFSMIMELLKLVKKHKLIGEIKNEEIIEMFNRQYKKGNNGRTR